VITDFLAQFEVVNSAFVENCHTKEEVVISHNQHIKFGGISWKWERVSKLPSVMVLKHWQKRHEQQTRVCVEHGFKYVEQDGPLNSWKRGKWKHYE
jgi:hypothetical protein